MTKYGSHQSGRAVRYGEMLDVLDQIEAFLGKLDMLPEQLFDEFGNVLGRSKRFCKKRLKELESDLMVTWFEKNGS